MRDTDTGRVDAVFASTEDRAARSERLLAEFLALTERAVDALRMARSRRIDSIPPTKRRVLVVDDDPTICAAAQRTISRLESGPHVDFAGSVRMALRKLAEQPYHVIVVDWKLVNGEAPEVIGAARRALPLVYVILISGYLTPHDGPRMARSLEADDWLAKPFEPADLQYVVSKALDKFTDPRGPHDPHVKRRPTQSYRMIFGKEKKK